MYQSPIRRKNRTGGEEHVVAVVGWIALVLIALIIIVGLYVFFRSIPDIRRYRRIRNM